MTVPEITSSLADGGDLAVLSTMRGAASALKIRYDNSAQKKSEIKGPELSLDLRKCRGWTTLEQVRFGQERRQRCS